MKHFKVSPNSRSYNDGLIKLFIDNGVYSVHIDKSKNRLYQTKMVNNGDIFHIINNIGDYWIGYVLSEFYSVNKETSFYSLDDVRKCRITGLLPKDDNEYYNVLWKTEIICKVNWNKSILTKDKKKLLNQGFNAKTIKPLPWLNAELERPN